MENDEQQTRKQLQEIIDKKFKHYNNWAKTWSAIYHSALWLAAISSAISAIVLKLNILSNPQFQSDIAAILAGSAAILTTFALVGGVDRKWRANRKARSEIELLKIDLLNPKFNEAEIRKRLKEIISQQSRDISDAVRSE